MLKSVEQKGPTVKLETGVPALSSLGFFFFFSNTDMAPLSVYNVSNMRLNQSWT